MSKIPVEGIQPSILRWARKTCELSVEEAAHSLRCKSQDIEMWESGKGAPTYPQLEKLAKNYKRPLAVFFLPSPPEEKVPKTEFRTLPTNDLKGLLPDTYFRIRYAHAYQIALKELFENRNPAKRRIWESITLSSAKSIKEQASNISNLLVGTTVEKRNTWKNDDMALKKWRQAIEDVGVFVFKDAFKQKTISGFCLIDKNLPVVYLNNNTSKSRQIFSLLHELAHLLCGINGLSEFGTKYIDSLPPEAKNREIFCNAVAAEVLIPSDDFSQQTKNLPHRIAENSDELISKLVNRYKASRETVLRKFLNQDRISKVFYEKNAALWNTQKNDGEHAQKDKKKGGGNFYLTKGTYLSQRFTNEVLSRHERHQITAEQAADFLNLKPKNLAEFEYYALPGIEV